MLEACCDYVPPSVFVSYFFEYEISSLCQRWRHAVVTSESHASRMNLLSFTCRDILCRPCTLRREYEACASSQRFGRMLSGFICLLFLLLLFDAFFLFLFDCVSRPCTLSFEVWSIFILVVECVGGRTQGRILCTNSFRFDDMCSLQWPRNVFVTTCVGHYVPCPRVECCSILSGWDVFLCWCP